MTILLTGATGFVGTNFILQLHKKYNIIALVRKTSDIEKIKNYCKIYYYDDTIDSINNVFKSEKIDGVVHLAAYVLNSGHVLSDIHSMLYANIDFGIKILELVKKLKITFFINTASSACYCNSLKYRPSSLYAATKKAFEDIMEYYTLTSNTVFSNLLFFYTYGSNPKQLFRLLQKVSQTNEELLMSDGSQIVDYSHVYDVVNGFDCLIELIQKDPDFCKNKTFSLRGNERKSLKEVVMLYEKILGKKLNIKWGARPQRELEIMIPWEGGEKLPNWDQKISLKEGFAMLLNHELSQSGEIDIGNLPGGGG
ncbi:NAD-dependent epimerase/dehydratase family protein [Campylobacter jejuni]|nr:SDR family oxidoreductase [Campylobacter jejuni]ECR3001971.1 NAD-dependent epimerase/dehydratase family protein [Campylobacter jejuni]EDN6450096.1 NAD-dependent epimerase/dehydratase family protein [Campylobacter jejuni]EEP6346133.1 NAD-dependent epimerase/dehydratase family protein [Campylobacter jejuni]EFS2185475.1 NAD-dependent epimerase/dehydratase family protein [Campylobacter jejuni]